MKIKQAIVEGSKLSPKDLFVMSMHKLCEKFGPEQAMAQVYGVALRVAQECNCHFELMPDNDQNKETFLFWSKAIGDVRPEILN